jgi:hypothetical protein
MSQNNSLSVDVSRNDEPLILAVELTPQFTDEMVSQKPVTLNDLPVADHLEEITGYLAFLRVDSDTTDGIQVTYPAELLDPALYDDIGRDLLGWELKVVLTSQIDAYPVRGGMSLEKQYPITPQDVQAQQTWVESEAEDRTQIGFPIDAHITVPNSTSGVFLYYPLDAIVDSVAFASDLTFNFEERERE